MSGARESVLTAGGVRSPLIEAGAEGATEAVVFLHGNPGSHEDWTDLAGQAGEFARAVAFDMPGFGGARPPDDFAYDVPGYGRFIGDAFDELGIDRAHLVQHDLGGPFGFAWAVEQPDAYRSAVLMNTGMLTGRRWHRMARTWRRPVVGELVQALATKRALENGLTANGAQPLPEGFIERMWRDYDRTTKRTILKLYRSMDLPHPDGRRWQESFHERKIPALIVWGRRDRAVPEAAVGHLKTAFPEAMVSPLPESGHFPFADDPEGTAAAVIPFLRRVTRAEA